MAMVYAASPVGTSMRGNGRKGAWMVVAATTMSMAILMVENGNRDDSMDMALIPMLMAMYIKGSGGIILEMDVVSIFMPMEI